MTGPVQTPVEQAPAAQNPAPAAPVPASPLPAAAPAPTTPAASTETPAAPAGSEEYPDWAKDPKQAAAMVEQLRKEAAANRVDPKQLAADAAKKAQEEMTDRFAVMLGLKPGAEPTTPDALKAEYDKKLQEATQVGFNAKVELAVYRNAAAAGADPTAILDSASFNRTVAQVDPDDASAIQAAIKEAVKNNPRLAAQAAEPNPNPAPTGTGQNGQTPKPGATGAELAGGNGEANSLHAQLAEAEKAGDTRRVLSLKRQIHYQSQAV